LDALASHAHRLAHYADAEAYYNQVLEARQELLGPDHPRVVHTLEKYAGMLHELGREEQAHSLEGRAAEIRGRQVKKDAG